MLSFKIGCNETMKNVSTRLGTMDLSDNWRSKSGGNQGFEVVLSDVGSNLGCLGSCWSYVATSLAARWRPRAPRWAKMAPKSPKMSQDGAQEAAKCSQDGILARFWELLGSIFYELGGFFAVRLNNKKPWKTNGFRKFFEGLGSRMESKSKKIWPRRPCWVEVRLF